MGNEDDDEVITHCVSSAVGHVSAVGMVDNEDGGDEQDLDAHCNLLFFIDYNPEL